MLQPDDLEVLVAGLVARRSGSSRLSEVGGLVRSAPLVALLFALPALSLAGLPPFSGFVAKFAIVDAGFSASEWTAVGFSLAVGLLTLYSMTKIWAGVFWGERDEEPAAAPRPEGRFGSPIGMLGATGALAAVSLALAIWAGPIYDVTERAAEDLLDPRGYVEAVMERSP